MVLFRSEPQSKGESSMIVGARFCTLAFATITLGLFIPSSRSSPAHAHGVIETTLPGGLRFVLEERPSTETTAIRLLIGGGTLAEPENGRGVAELHARLLLRGTEARSGSELARAADDMGGRLSAYAGLRSETIGLDVPAESTAQAIRLAAEILLHPRFDRHDLDKEKNLLIGSLAASRDDPTNDLEDEVLRLLFPKHPLSHLIRLEDAQVRAVSIDDIRALHGRLLTAARLALVVVGRCDRAVVEATAVEAFKELDTRANPGFSEGTAVPGAIGRFSEGKDVPSAELADHGAWPTWHEEEADHGPFAGDPVPPPAPLSDDVHKRVRKRTTQAEIMVSLPTCGVSDEEAPAYSILRFLLGGFQERLSREVREKRGYAYWLAAEGLALPTSGWFGIHTGARKTHLAEIERIVRSELDRIVEEPASAEEMERARRYLTTSEARLDATNGGRASILAGALLDGRPLRTYEERVARLAEVRSEEVQRLARRLFEGHHLAVVTLY